jgi:ATP-dependent Lon protease
MTVPSDRETMNLPVLPLRDVVVFPHMVIPLFVGRDKSIRALDLAMEADKRILLVAQRSAETDDPTGKDLYDPPARISMTPARLLRFCSC